MLWCYVGAMMDRINIESSELEAAEIVEGDDTEELVPKRGAVSVWRFFGLKKI